VGDRADRSPLDRVVADRKHCVWGPEFPVGVRTVVGGVARRKLLLGARSESAPSIAALHGNDTGLGDLCAPATSGVSRFAPAPPAGDDGRK
jgi:hypothetical protein